MAIGKSLEITPSEERGGGPNITWKLCHYNCIEKSMFKGSVRENWKGVQAYGEK